MSARNVGGWVHVSAGAILLALLVAIFSTSNLLALRFLPVAKWEGSCDVSGVGGCKNDRTQKKEKGTGIWERRRQE